MADPSATSDPEVGEEGENLAVALVVPDSESPADASKAGVGSRPSRAGKKVPRWNDTEEAMVRTLVEQAGASRDWNELSDQLGTGRTGAAVEQHW